MARPLKVWDLTDASAGPPPCPHCGEPMERVCDETTPQPDEDRLVIAWGHRCIDGCSTRQIDPPIPSDF